MLIHPFVSRMCLVAVVLAMCPAAHGAVSAEIASGKVVLSDRVSGWSTALRKPGPGRSKTGQVAWRHRVSGEPEHEFVTEITNTSDKLRCMAIEYQFQIAGNDLGPFLAGVNPEPDWPHDGEIAYAYVRESPDWIRLSVPFATLTSRAGHFGVSFAADLAAIPILPFEVRMRQQNGRVRVVIRRPQLRLEPKGSVTIKLFAAAHGGDRREGLAWMRRKWPKLFTVRDGLERFQYCMWTGGSIPSDECFEKGTKEAHLHKGIWQIRPRPWFGLSCSDHEPWLLSVDQKWYCMKEMTDLPGHPGKDAKFDAILKFMRQIKDTEEVAKRLRAKTPVSVAYTWRWLTHDDIRAWIKRIKDAGFQMLYYWNPSETWNKWAEKFYPESLYVPFSTDFWKDSTVLDPAKGSARARDLVADAKRVFDEYPECDGLFMDQVYYDLDNDKGDDGISINPKGKPFSRHQWNTYCVIKEIRKIADERGKVLQPNFIFNSLEIASLTDFGLVENVEPLEETGFFYDIGNRIHICQSHEERSDQICALLGWQSSLWTNPKLPYDNRRGRFWLSRLARPIQMLFQGRALVLEPNCLELPDGFEGNVFKQPSGNYVVTIVTPGVSHLSPYSFSNVPVVVRIKDAPTIKRVYQLSSDRLGPVVAPFKIDNGELRATLSRHRSISALVLARTGKFIALKDAAVVKAEDSARLVRDDVAVGSRETFTAKVKPGLAGFATFQIEPELGLTLPRADIETDGKPTFEVRIVPDIEVTLAPPPSRVVPLHHRDRRMLNEGAVVLPLGEKARFVATVRNHANTPRTINLAVSATGASVRQAKKSVKLEAKDIASIPLDATLEKVGQARITVDAGTKATIHFEVTGTSLAGVDLSTAKSAVLIVDSIGGPGIGQKILLNGVEAGKLVQRIGTPVWDFGARHELSKGAVKALKEDNLIEIETGQKKFAVKDLKLEVVLAGGVRYILAADALAQSTPPDWRQACGKRVPSGSRMRWNVPSAKTAALPQRSNKPSMSWRFTRPSSGRNGRTAIR